jgi:hypothetical protein
MGVHIGAVSLKTIEALKTGETRKDRHANAIGQLHLMVSAVCLLDLPDATALMPRPEKDSTIHTSDNRMGGSMRMWWQRTAN